MSILKNKRTIVLIIMMGTIVLLGVIIGHFYYKYENESVDPRIVKANLLYSKYNELTQESDYEAVFGLMDSIESIYNSTKHYHDSYEVGVLYNNRAAAYIAMALAPENNDSIVKDSLLKIAHFYSNKSINIYTLWINDWGELTEEEIREKLDPCFSSNDPAFGGKRTDRFINKRTKDIREAQFETHRRLSVSYTNEGLIYRHKGRYEEAAESYFTALELWPDNIAAENNLNIILNQPVKKRSVFRRLFPKDRRNI